MQKPHTASAASFLSPFEREQLEDDILHIALLHLRVTHLFAEETSVWALANKSPAGQMWNPDASPADLGLLYADFANCNFARAIQQQYDYGFFGVLRDGIEPLEYESIHTWVAAYLMDLKNSESAAEWASYGADFSDSIDRCLRVSELANARLVLEGSDETFSYFSRVARERGEDATSVSGLTVRQLALLSGMEEMSVRTAVSRKALEAFKHEGRTLFEPSVAKAWLQAKGRYVSVTRKSSAAGFDWEKERFSSVEDLIRTIQARAHERLAETETDIQGQLDEVARRAGSASYDALSRENLLNPELMAHVANVLALPAELLVLRARETVLRSELAAVEQQLRAVASAKAPSGGAA